MPTPTLIPEKTTEEQNDIKAFFDPILSSAFTVIDSASHKGRILLSAQIALFHAGNRKVLFHSDYSTQAMFRKIFNECGYLGLYDVDAPFENILTPKGLITDSIDFVNHGVLMIDTERQELSEYLITQIIFAARMGRPVILFVDTAKGRQNNINYGWSQALRRDRDLGRLITYRLAKLGESDQWTPSALHWTDDPELPKQQSIFKPIAEPTPPAPTRFNSVELEMLSRYLKKDLFNFVMEHESVYHIKDQMTLGEIVKGVLSFKHAPETIRQNIVDYAINPLRSQLRRRH